MKIETKYDIGQEVWFMEINRPFCNLVAGYRTSYGKGDYFGEFMTGEPKCVTTYYVKGDKNSIGSLQEESSLFPTKEELLKSL